jgi:hypothetical protein
MLTTHAQTIPYEKLDSISDAISKLQTEANGRGFNDVDKHYEISFPTENFRILFSDQLAYKTVYKKLDEKEILVFTENIDLSEATGIIKQTSYTNIIGIKLYFPKGYLKSQIFENGILTNTVTEDYLEFYTKIEQREQLYKSILDACNILQIAKGSTTKEKIVEEDKDYSSLSNENFTKKYPNSLKTMQAKLFIKQKEEERLEKERLETLKQLKISNFIDSICNVYKFKVRMKETEFRNFNSEANNMMTTRNYGDGFGNTTSNVYSQRKNNTLGSSTVSFDKKGELISYTYIIIRGKKNQAELMEYYQEILKQIEAVIPKEFVTKSDNSIKIYYNKKNIEIYYNFLFNPYTNVNEAYIHFLAIDR